MAKSVKHTTIFIIMLIIISVIAYFSYFLFKAKSMHPTTIITQNINIVKPQTNTTSLFFTGNISPLHVYNVTSPIDGTVMKLNFQYGQTIYAKQYLLSISSDKSEQDYRDTLTNYLKAKNAFLTAKSQFLSQQFLYQNGLIPRNEFQSSRSELENNELSYRQSIFALKANIQKIMPNNTDRKQLFNSLTQLTLGDTAVNQALNMQFSVLKIYAPHEGIALFPIKTNTSDNAVYEGSAIKSGGVLLSIGDMTGLSIQVLVNEININKIKSGQHVIITSIAFPNITLKGYVATVAAQAKSDGDSSTLPAFPVTIIIPKLTDAERQVIHVGMTAQITLEISKPDQIMVPIADVTQTSNGNYVTVMRNGKKQVVQVITGETTLTQVAIVHGLEAGDKIVSVNPVK